MDEFECISFAYFPPEAEIPVVSWCLKRLDLKLAETGASLLISDMKFVRGGLDISWDLTGTYSSDLEWELEQQFDWIYRKATKVF